MALVCERSEVEGLFVGDHDEGINPGEYDDNRNHWIDEDNVDSFSGWPDLHIPQMGEDCPPMNPSILGGVRWPPGDDVFTKQEPDASHPINETLHRNCCLTLCRFISHCCEPCLTDLLLDNCQQCSNYPDRFSKSSILFVDIRH